MAEKYRFFDAVEDENGLYDREYNAQEFTDYFKALVTTGIMKGAGNELAVSTNGSSMITSVSTGIAFLLGRYYENDSPLELTHDTETLGNSRIDRIVIRMDLNTNARYVRAFIKKGVPSTNPVAPTLTQTANLYEISLAQVRIVGGQTFIATNAVTDERGTDVICPWAGSNILPNFNDDALQELIENQLTDGKNAKGYLTGHLNDLTTSGFYYSNGADTSRGFPENFSGSYKVKLEVIKITDGWIYQKYTRSTYSAYKEFTRVLVLGTWGDWVETITSNQIIYGTGAPEGVVAASVGTIYIRTTGGAASTTLFVKTSGSGNTGWTAK